MCYMRIECETSCDFSDNYIGSFHRKDIINYLQKRG